MSGIELADKAEQAKAILREIAEKAPAQRAIDALAEIADEADGIIGTLEDAKAAADEAAATEDAKASEG